MLARDHREDRKAGDGCVALRAGVAEGSERREREGMAKELGIGVASVYRVLAQAAKVPIE